MAPRFLFATVCFIWLFLYEYLRQVALLIRKNNKNYQTSVLALAFRSFQDADRMWGG